MSHLPYARLTKAQAEQLHADIRDGLLNIERKIAEFAKGGGHLALGYRSFAEYWLDRMADVSLRQTEALYIVACVMYDEGATPDEVAATVRGIAPRRAAAVLDQKNLGVAPDKIRVREHDRKAERAPNHVVHVSLPPSTFRRYRAVARRTGSTLEAEAEMALRLHFAELIARGGDRGAA